MRKVKELVAEFKANGATMDAFTRIVNEMLLQDIPEIKEQRRVITDDGVLRIIDTVEERFRAFALQAPPIDRGTKILPEHFGPVLKAALPRVHDLWQFGKMRKRHLGR